MEVPQLLTSLLTSESPVRLPTACHKYREARHRITRCSSSAPPIEFFTTDTRISVRSSPCEPTLYNTSDISRSRRWQPLFSLQPYSPRSAPLLFSILSVPGPVPMFSYACMTAFLYPIQWHSLRIIHTCVFNDVDAAIWVATSTQEARHGPLIATRRIFSGRMSAGERT